MSAPVVSSLWDSWAQAFADAVKEVADQRGDLLDREVVLREIRACLMEPLATREGVRL